MAKPFLFGKVDAGRVIKNLQEVAGKLGDLERTDQAIAAELAGQARALALGLGSVHAHVASGIQAQGRKVGLNVAAQPAILGAEFGGGARPTTRQFPPWKGTGPQAGYMLYEAIRQRNVVEKYGELLDKITD